MIELRHYLNSLGKEERDRYAKSCGTTVGYLRKAISSGTSRDGALALKLDENSGGKVKKQNIRPDIWPELTGRANINGQSIAK